MGTSGSQRSAGILASQRAYYDERAPDYGDATVPDRAQGPGGLLGEDIARRLVAEIDPNGDVLELACGTGIFTRALARHARSVTALDASPRMLERNRQTGAPSNVRLVAADVFDWQPDRQYDVVFFGHWLSHVPPDAFDRFWALVAACLRPGGRAAFVDEDDRASAYDDCTIVDGTPVALRTLRDGTKFDIVKVFWDPDELAARLAALGWTAAIHRADECTLVGIATPNRSN
jgi:demethylmenaquinone methyltransferase/2-methoxy-6-polyprenyl-1,4-benzoquinol methylase